MIPLERKLKTDLMRFMGLRPRLELALPARLFLVCAATIKEHPESGSGEVEFCDFTMPVLREAAYAPVDVIKDAKLRAKAREILADLSAAVLVPYQERPRALVYTMLIHWLNGLVDDGHLSADWPPMLHEALNSFVEVLNQHPDVVEEINRSAAKNARRLREQLRGLGLYQTPKEAAA